MLAAGASARAAGDLVASSALIAAARAAEAAVALLDDDNAELHLRLEAATPELSAAIDAGTLGKLPTPNSARRATRNVAMHWHPGAGPAAVTIALNQPKRSQRGGRGRKPTQHSHAADVVEDLAVSYLSDTPLLRFLTGPLIGSRSHYSQK